MIDSSAAPAPTPAASPPLPAWRDLAIYVAGGFGVFLLASLVLGLAIGQADRLTIWISLTLYLVNFVCLGGAVYVLGIRRRKFTWADMGLWPPRVQWYWPLVVVGVALAILPLRAGLGLLVQLLLGGDLQSLQTRAQVFVPGAHFSWLDFAVTLLGAGLLAPISEELYFRGLIHRWLQPRFTFWVRVLISTSFFALAHFDSLAVVVASFLLGMACAVIYELSQSLWMPILMHIFNNSLAVVLMYAAILASQFLPKT
jgi:membrane protease YdiL (CAAX protease family)